MSINVIEKNKQENIDLLQIEQLSDLPISKTDIVVIEPNSTISIMMRKFLVKVGFENIQICKEAKEGIQIFSHFISNDINTPIIIDSGSNKNLKKIIKEILEIQPNAKAIISSAKERDNPEILKLFDIGITSTLHKPFILEDFKKCFQQTNEDEESESRTKAIITEPKEVPATEPKEVPATELESLLLSHNQITFTKFKDIYNIERTRAEKIFNNALSRKLITPHKEISEAACSQCNSTNITYTSECPQCGGTNFQQKDLVEHYDCGEIYVKGSDYKTCPKCNKQIGSVGTDYREFAGYHICSSCNERFDRPLFKFSCLSCGNSFIDVMALWKKSKLYKIQK